MNKSEECGGLADGELSLVQGGSDGESGMDIVDRVIRGDYGNGQDRPDRLRAAGYDYGRVQNEVNRRLGFTERHLIDYSRRPHLSEEAEGTAMKELNDEIVGSVYGGVGEPDTVGTVLSKVREFRGKAESVLQSVMKGDDREYQLRFLVRLCAMAEEVIEAGDTAASLTSLETALHFAELAERSVSHYAYLLKEALELLRTLTA